MIDLRSDTITVPTEPMRHAMAMAEVGDDVFGEDPTVRALEERVAGLLGHEAGLFVTSGSMGNQLGLRVLATGGEEVLCDVQAHILRHELGAAAELYGLTTRTFASDHGVVTPSAVLAHVVPDAGAYAVSTGVVALENTHGECGGRIQPYGALVEISETCRDAGVRLHLDGARLWNAHVATGGDLADSGRLFDTVTVCLSKGLGAPVGSVLVSSTERIAEARIWRKRAGGGWRQAGILAAAGIYALDHHLDRLADDHEAAAALAAELPGQPAPETNMIMIDTAQRPAIELADAAEQRGVRLFATGPRTLRAVTSRMVSVEQCREAGRTLATLLGSGQ